MFTNPLSFLNINEVAFIDVYEIRHPLDLYVLFEWVHLIDFQYTETPYACLTTPLDSIIGV